MQEYVQRHNDSMRTMYASHISQYAQRIDEALLRYLGALDDRLDLVIGRLKNPFSCMAIPLIPTTIWFIYGYVNNFAYPCNLEPMYPGIIASGILCYINKKTIL